MTDTAPTSAFVDPDQRSANPYDEAVAADPVPFYAALRELYRQFRNNAIRNGEAPFSEDLPSIDIPDYEDEEDTN